MCGLTGFLRAGPLGSASAEWLRRMSDCLQHRGPDAGGTWLDDAAGVALAHRRLAIIELSAAGAQPMHSASARFVIVYNGEIYNHLELRREIEATGAPVAWRGHSDTETLLRGIEHLGLGRTLAAARGMFAFALWDREQRRLTLARDRLGEKPLYYGRQGEYWLFGSELKALRAHPAFDAGIDRAALAQLLARGFVGAPASIYSGIHKLPPGCTVTLQAGSAGAPVPYWSLAAVAAQGLAQPFEGDDEAAVRRLDQVLGDAVVEQTIADVPVGAFLSGGIDSTSVVAQLQARSSRSVRTFTIGFREAEFDEARHAAAVAAHLGTDHAELQVTARDALDIVPRMPQLFDEPFGDSSAIPTHLVSAFARRHVTVSLSGDGGDELFGGYHRYHQTARIWRGVGRVPGFARALLSGACRAAARLGGDADESRLARLSRYLAARSGEACYATQVELWPGPMVRDGDASLAEPPAALARGDLYARMMFADAVSYLPDDILAKVDRAAMAVSLETRVPMLDPRVVEFAWSLPARMKVRDGDGKWLLKRVLDRYVPRELMERPKMGFGVPVAAWLRGPLRPWAEELLAESRLRGEGYFDAARVRRRWARHLAGHEDAADALWPVLMFQAWLTAPALRAAV
jgi:asparagine synthase (glutamine-hydrolysing)